MKKLKQIKLAKQVLYRKPISPQKPKELKCHVCEKMATHVVLVELRAEQGPPLKENNVLRVACPEHAANTNFDYWVPFWAFKKLCIDWKNEADVILNKAYCTIKVLKLKEK